MKVIKLDKTCLFEEKIALCLGYFDGLHKGHVALINKAKESGYKVALLTFDVSPKQYLNNLQFNVILDEQQRNELLNDAEVDYLLIQKFDENFSNMSTKDFINYLKNLNPSLLVVGYDYRFGKNAKGDVSLLKEHFKVIEVEQVKDEKGKYSTSRIMSSLESGNIDDVTFVLGRFYSINGKVVKGLQNGGKIGFKTANMDLNAPYYLPKKGVYACFAYVDDKQYYAMVNVGVHPTIDKLNETIVEVHLLDFDSNIYEKEIRIEFVKFIRDEKLFKTLDELIAQLKNDKEVIRNLLSHPRIRIKY